MTTPIDPTRTDPIDPLPPAKFSSWHCALKENLLKPAEVAVLQTMVDEGQAPTLDAAASILDRPVSIVPIRHFVLAYAKRAATPQPSRTNSRLHVGRQLYDWKLEPQGTIPCCC